MPSRRSKYRWLGEHLSFQPMYAAAWTQAADLLFDKSQQIAEEAPKCDERGRVDQGWVARQRIRLGHLRWQMGRQAPKKYGDRTEIVGVGGEPLIREPLSELGMARRIAFALTKAVQSDPAATPLRLTREPLPAIDLDGKPIGGRPWN